MRKLIIVEIENSYLNFFTPAVCIAAGLFLYSLISWPLSLLNWVFHVFKINIDLKLVPLILQNLSGFLVCLVVYFVFIPRLKVQDADFKKASSNSFFIVLLVFWTVIFFRVLLTAMVKFFGVKIEAPFPWFLKSYDQLLDPMFMFFFLLYQLIISPPFTELVYRRTVIPLLEDRGLSPIHAVILSSLGFCFLYLPSYLQTSNPLNSLYWFVSTFLFGFATGIIYILTRNILFPILYAAFYYAYRLTYNFGSYFGNELLLMIRNLTNYATLLAGFVVITYVILKLIAPKSPTNWVNIIKMRSMSNIKRGFIGFFIISLGLTGIQLLMIPIHKILTFSEHFIFNTIFYLVAFTIPFWLIIKTEYAQY